MRQIVKPQKLTLSPVMSEDAKPNGNSPDQELVDQLRRSNQFLEAAFNATGALCAFSDFNTTEYLDVNDAWVETLGWSRKEAIGKTALGLNVWGTPENRQRIVDAVNDDGSLQNFPITAYTRSGEPRSILLDAKVLTIDDRQVIFSAGVDITEREQIETQLRQSQRLEAIGQLTGGIAHDLNNMLTIILGQIDLTKNKHDVQRLHQAMDIIRHATERGADLIEQLLTFSRNQELKPGVIDVADAIQRMQPLLEGSFGGEANIEIQIDGFDHRGYIDETMLETAILNLVINARDAMPEGGGSITLRVGSEHIDGFTARRFEVPSGDYTTLTVIDTGSGMSEAILNSALEPFFTTKPMGQGTGLGLSMVFGFVKQSGGHLEIKSELDVGTEVKMWLPMTSDEGTATQKQKNKDSDLANKRVLIIEDSVELTAVLRQLLQSYGCQVIIKNEEGLANLDEPIDAILSDVILPGIKQGPDYVNEILAKQPGTKVLFMSGYPQEKLKESGLEFGTPFIKKPFSREELKIALTRLFTT